MPAYVYILECSDGTYYTGWARDVGQRVKAHNEGRGAKYTRSRNPVKLVYSECFEKDSDARKREVRIKRLSRAEKKALVKRKGGSS